MKSNKLLSRIIAVIMTIIMLPIAHLTDSGIVTFANSNSKVTVHFYNSEGWDTPFLYYY